MSTITAAIVSLLLFVGASGAGWFAYQSFAEKLANANTDLNYPATQTGTIGGEEDSFRPSSVISERVLSGDRVVGEEESSTSTTATLGASELPTQSFRFSDRILEEFTIEDALRRDQVRLNELQGIYAALEEYAVDMSRYPDQLGMLAPAYLFDDQIVDESTAAQYEYRVRDGGMGYVLCASFETEQKACYEMQQQTSDALDQQL